MRLLLLLIIFSSQLFSQENDVSKWKPFEMLIGKWQGTGEGKYGNSTVEREYFYIMDSTFLMAKNISVYEKQRKNPDGTIQESWDIFSYDTKRLKYVFRQFHSEGIVYTFVADSFKIAKGIYEFDSESAENFSEGWKAKEVYKFLDKDEFIEIFYLSADDKQFKEYIRNSFKRVK